MLGQVRDGLFDAVLDNEELVADEVFVTKLDELLVAITNIEVTRDVELSREAENKEASKSGASSKLALKLAPTFEVQIGGDRSTEGRDLRREVRRGTERLSRNSPACVGTTRSSIQPEPTGLAR